MESKLRAYAWWKAPILFAFMGGLAAWLGVKDENANTARNMLITCIALTLPWFLVCFGGFTTTDGFS